MKASELIIKLQTAIETHGDLPVGMYNDEWDRWHNLDSNEIVYVSAQLGRGKPGSYSYFLPTEPMLGVR